MLLYTILDLMAAVLLAILARRVFLIAWVKGRSMMNTLRHRQLLFALRYGPRRQVARFDVVLCRYPNRREMFVKRVIGLPGEEISMAEGTVLINDVPLSEDFDKRPSRGSFPPRQLGEEEYFVMGDNRPCSSDSRSPRVGPIPRSMILAWVCLPRVSPRRDAAKD